MASLLDKVYAISILCLQRAARSLGGSFVKWGEVSGLMAREFLFRLYSSALLRRFPPFICDVYYNYGTSGQGEETNGQDCAKGYSEADPGKDKCPRYFLRVFKGISSKRIP